MPIQTGANQIILFGSTDVTTLFSGATTALNSPVATPTYRLSKVVLASITAGGSATILIYGNTREQNANGILIATITLTPSVPLDGFAFDAPWPYIYAEIQSGSGGAVTVDLGG